MIKFANRLKERFSESQIAIGIMTFFAIMTGLVFMCLVCYHRTYHPSQFLYNNMQSQRVGYIDFGEREIFSYGPYEKISIGNYRISIEYETAVDSEFDVIYRNADGEEVRLLNGSLYADTAVMTRTFYNDQYVKNSSFEVRTWYPGEGEFRLSKVTMHYQFVFKWYILVTILTAILSLWLFQGHKIKYVVKHPKKALYFSAFYAIIIMLSLCTMVFLPGQHGQLFYIGMNLLIILHAYGMKRRIYNRFTLKGAANVTSYVLLTGSVFLLDFLLRYETSTDTMMSYRDSIPNLFTFCFVVVMLCVLSLIKKTWIRRLVYGVVYYLFMILLLVQIIYYRVFGKLFSFKDILLAKEGSDYNGYILSLFEPNLVKLIVFLLFVGIIGIVSLQSMRQFHKEGYLVLASVLLSLMMYADSLYTSDYGAWDSFDNVNYIYASMTNRLGAFELCGFYQYELKDLKTSLFDNIRDRKEQVEEIEQYYDSKKVSSDNEMTGLLENKNVIFVLMESIDDIALNEQVMPTLYKMSREGICFNNLYASIYGTAATINAETVTNVGLYAPIDGSLVYGFADNQFPYSLANRFTQKGYVAQQFHFNHASFYNRTFLNQAFGYSSYICYQDYVTDHYREDDILVKDDTLYEILTEDNKFFDYVISYSAHLPYDENNDIVEYALDEYPEYSELTDSEEINNYFATARVTDDLLSGLLIRLEEDGLMDNTIIVAVGDHYPYGIQDEETLYELSGVDSYKPLLYKVPFVIYGTDLEPVTVDKVMSSIDIVPTLVNLMGWDNREVYVGHDGFDPDYRGYAYFADGSWLTDEAFYYNGKLVSGYASDEEIGDMNKLVMDTININDDILKSDFYRSNKIE